MSTASWQFQTTEGVVTVRHDAIVVHSRPWQFLAGQRARWRHGDRSERVRTVGSLVAFFGIFYTAFRLTEFFGQLASGSTRLLVTAFAAAIVVYSFWREHASDTTIPRTAIESIALDEADRELTIAHDEQQRLRRALSGDETETSLTLPSMDDVREAKEVLQLRSFDVERVEDAVETVTEHRFVTRQGASFCPGCDRRVSPNDRTCGRCGTVLRYERPVGGRSSAERTGSHREPESEAG